MAESMKEIIMMIKSKVKECFYGLMVVNMMVPGQQASNTVLASIPQAKARSREENGKKERELDGLEQLEAPINLDKMMND